MKLFHRLAGFSLCLMLCFALFPAAEARRGAAGEKSDLLRALDEELVRSRDLLAKKGDPPPYYLGFYVAESEYATVSSSYGALRLSVTSRRRSLDVDVRVGGYEMDNTHSARSGGGNIMGLPVDGDLDALKNEIWIATNQRYDAAVKNYLALKASRAARVDDEDKSPDFSREEPQRGSHPLRVIQIDRAEWESKTRRVSAVFNKYPEILSATVIITEEATNKFIANTEGTSLEFGQLRALLSIVAITRAEDGMTLFRFESFEAQSAAGLPPEDKLIAAAEKMALDLVALKKAPVIEPYAGPAILSGRAAGVFFHEIFGHRIEGHRQRDEMEGGTFAKKLNQAILPAFLSVADDPTQTRAGEIDLSGAYLFDDEGVPAQRVAVVEKGVLKNFLMSRLPIEGFGKSNGHGRKSPGAMALGRQGNLIVKSAAGVPRERLREMLKAELKKQHKPFGLYFEDVSGGFTNTMRAGPQSFQVMPIMVYKVFADGKPDELVRGVDLIGTPLTVFSKIIATDDREAVFNGICGAESGFVPVSAVAPGLLVSQIEVQKRAKANERLPVLGPPRFDTEKKGGSQ